MGLFSFLLGVSMALDEEDNKEKSIFDLDDEEKEIIDNTDYEYIDFDYADDLEEDDYYNEDDI